MTMRYFVLSLLMFATTALGVSPALAQARAPKVDHHLHINSDSAASAMERISQAALGQDINQEPIPADSVIQILDSSGVEKGVLLSPAYFFGSPFIDVNNAYEKVKAENDYVAHEASKYPERLIAFCSFNPLSDYALKEMRRCAENADITGVKLHLANAQFDFRNTEHVQKLGEVFQEAARLDLPIVVHTWTGRSYGRRDARIFIDEVLTTVPDLPVQIAHMGSVGVVPDSAMQAFVEAAAEKPNIMDEDVVFDLSAAFGNPAAARGDTAQMKRIRTMNDRLVRQIRRIGVDRVVFASDWPAPSLPWAAKSVEILRSILDQQTLESLFDNTAPYVR